MERKYQIAMTITVDDVVLNSLDEAPFQVDTFTVYKVQYLSLSNLPEKSCSFKLTEMD